MTTLPPKTQAAIKLDADDTQTAIEIALRRAELLGHLREAIESHRVSEVYRLSRIIVGLPPEVTDDGTGQPA
jgi:hypothetical protein